MQIAALLTEARHALSVGDRAKAKQLASQALRLDSKHIETWLLLADLVEVPAQKRDCFQRILAIDPTNPIAKQALNQLDAPAPVAAASFELPKSAWFGNKSAEPELTAQVGGPIATSTLPKNSPSGIRPLAQAQTPSLVELSNTPAIPTGYVQPTQPAYNQPNYAQPNQAFIPPVANYGQAQPQYGQVVYPHVEPSGVAKFLKWLVFAVFGLMVVCFGISVLSDLGKEPPPTPKVSAQDRTTAMLNDIVKMSTNPQSYGVDGAKLTAEPLVKTYFAAKYRRNPRIYAEDMIGGLKEGAGDDIQTILPLIAQAYVTPIQYSVISEVKDQKIRLKIISGDMVIVVKNNQFVTNPLNEMYDIVTLINEDGIWYVDDIQYN
ncbi:hypothetical protein [Herpetosiphon gulosus]|uniref:Uncharacterized protein n=1 Tax=Herpetosiphon gulosus TaxID=1973496 RepID=A0ABP9WXP6_9CHLR